VVDRTLFHGGLHRIRQRGAGRNRMRM